MTKETINENAPEITTLYKGRMTVKFYPKSHQYWVSVDGEKLKRWKGSTTFIGIKDKSRALLSWQQGITADYLLKIFDGGERVTRNNILEAVIQSEIQKDKAADIGNEIHGWAEGYIKYKMKLPGFKKMPEIPDFPEAVTGVNSFLDWDKQEKVEYHSTETVIASLEHRYIGTEDVTFTAGGKFCDADFKSSNGLYNGVRAQTASYAMARMEAGGRKSKGRWALRFSKYTEEEYIKREERKKEIRRMIAKIKGREYKEYPIKPYQVFEAKFLDNEKGNLERDFNAFLDMKKLTEWDRLTDPFLCGENW